MVEEHTPSQHTASSSTMQDVKKTRDIGSRPLPDLPPELHEVIVNHLKGDNWTLKQCALTCRLYRRLAQPRLFESIEFRFSAYPHQTAVTADRFLDILQDSPQIASYVQRLTLWDRYFPAGPIQKEEAIAQVLPALSNVVHLILGQLPHFIRFVLLESSTQLAITKKCEILRSLTLYGVESMPLGIFDHLRRLEKLSLEKVLFINNAVMQDAQTIPYQMKDLAVRSVEIHGLGSIYPFLVQQGIGIGSLETLSIDLSLRGRGTEPSKHFQAAKRLISSSAGSLRVLNVTFSTDVPVMIPSDEPVFDLSEMPLLEECSLGGVVCKMGIETGGPIDLGWLSRHLETISVSQKFKTLTLYPVIDGAKLITDDKLDPGGFKYFEKLVLDVVSPRTGFFSIQFMISDEEDESPIQEQMQKHLPTLHALNLLHFDEY